MTQEFERELEDRFEVRICRGGGAALASALTEVEILLVRSEITIDSALLDRAPHLRMIGRLGSGVDNLDLASCTARGVRAFHIPGGNARSVAELGLGLVVAGARGLLRGAEGVRRGEFRKQDLCGRELRGCALGLVGFGRIGSELARIARPLFGRILAARRRSGEELRLEMARAGAELRSLDDVLSGSDVVVLAVPLDETTRGLLGGRALRRMRAGALLVNLAREGVVDPEALAEAVTRRGLCYASDVGLPPWAIGHPRCIGTPHIGAQTLDARRRIESVALQAMLGHPITDGETLRFLN